KWRLPSVSTFVPVQSGWVAPCRLGAHSPEGFAITGSYRLSIHRLFALPVPGFRSLEEELSAVPADAALDEELEGSVMLYSSGTTGRPKGVRRPLPRVPAGDPATVITAVGLTGLFGMKEGDVYLSPAPLYHAAPLVFASTQHRIGATAVV